MSKALATIATQPLIVAKVGLQSRPPPNRKGKSFKSFVEVMRYIVENEGLSALFKGIGPQILKGVLVQGLLMMIKERYVTSASFWGSILITSFVPNRVEILFVLLIAYLRRLHSAKLQRAAEFAALNVRQALPVMIK